MLFNSLAYGLFLVIVFFLYWFPAKNSLKAQNIILLVASYVFYGTWDWRFLFLLIFSTFLDYYTGAKIHQSKSKHHRKLWLATSIVINLGFLCFFKYYNFFTQSFADLLVHFDLKPNMPLLKVILPVGISFYTFHGLSYVFDIYNKKIEPTMNFVDYSLFVSFFPLLVAGPIERATHLLPQVKAPRRFDYNLATDGLRQILWGLFKKIVIADSCAVIVDDVFAHPEGYSSLSLATGAILFAFQIYGDFSGYSDIAIGSARLLGFDLLRNFNYPYFARDIADFWRRWHMSLTSWFRDYLYIPLGGSRGSKLKTVRNTIIVFLVSGLWHGANWTFIVWGAYHAALFLPLLLLNKKRMHVHGFSHGFRVLGDIGKIFTTFILVTIGWVVFRADSLSAAVKYFSNMISQHSARSVFDRHDTIVSTLIFILLLVFAEWWQKNKTHALNFMPGQISYTVRTLIYSAVIISILWYGAKPAAFIYFQF
jgi:D-alanyl-lipoteichoic acid acyltransferase DltB (MBOAT superfamily)